MNDSWWKSLIGMDQERFWTILVALIPLVLVALVIGGVVQAVRRHLKRRRP